jgi:hypothetical protein
MYLRQNATEEFLGDMRTSRSPQCRGSLPCWRRPSNPCWEESAPAAEDAIEMAKGRVCLVDGTITPSWSYADRRDLWSRKHGTTGFNAQLASLLDGDAIYISDPLDGRVHDANAFTSTPVAEIVRNSGGGNADKGTSRLRDGHATQETGRQRASAAGEEIQHQCLVAAGTRRNARSAFQVLAHLPHRLPPPVPNPLERVRRRTWICSSSHSHGVLNNVPKSPWRLDGSTAATMSRASRALPAGRVACDRLRRP